MLQPFYVFRAGLCKVDAVALLKSYTQGYSCQNEREIGKREKEASGLTNQKKSVKHLHALHEQAHFILHCHELVCQAESQLANIVYTAGQRMRRLSAHR